MNTNNKNNTNNINKNNKERTVVTVIYNNKPYVFGSLASIFVYFNSDQLGITYNTLRTIMGKNKNIYKNDYCYIERSKLLTKAMHYNTINTNNTANVA